MPAWTRIVCCAAVVGLAGCVTGPGSGPADPIADMRLAIDGAWAATLFIEDEDDLAYAKAALRIAERLVDGYEAHGDAFDWRTALDAVKPELGEDEQKIVALLLDSSDADGPLTWRDAVRVALRAVRAIKEAD